jgi:putative transposase
MIERKHPVLSVRRQCELLALSRSGLYYKGRGESPENLALMRVAEEERVEADRKLCDVLRQLAWTME